MDERDRRGLAPDQRAHFLAMMRRNGATVDQAAAAAGLSLNRLSAAAQSDGELRAALDGFPVPVQKAARFGDYLAALARTGGDVSLAVAVARTSIEGVSAYRKSDQHFRKAEEAVREWLEHTDTRIATRLSNGQLEYAAQLLESGTRISEAGRAVGVTSTELRNAEHRNARLKAALPPKTTGRPSKMTEQAAQRLRELWADPDKRLIDIAGELGVSKITVSRWVDELELPRRKSRPAFYRRRKRTADPAVQPPVTDGTGPGPDAPTHEDTLCP